MAIELPKFGNSAPQFVDVANGDGRVRRSVADALGVEQPQLVRNNVGTAWNEALSQYAPAHGEPAANAQVVPFSQKIGASLSLANSHDR